MHPSMTSLNICLLTDGDEMVTFKQRTENRYEVRSEKRLVGSVVKLRGWWQYVARVEDKQLPPAAHMDADTAFGYVITGLRMS